MEQEGLRHRRRAVTIGPLLFHWQNESGSKGHHRLVGSRGKLNRPAPTVERWESDDRPVRHHSPERCRRRARRGACPTGRRARPHRGFAHPRPRAWRHGDQRRNGLCQGRAAAAGEARGGHRRGVACQFHHRGSRSGGSWVREHPVGSGGVPRGDPRRCSPPRGVCIPTPARSTRVNVEYVSANPTGPMHVGHCRGAVVGDALANLASPRRRV